MSRIHDRETSESLPINEQTPDEKLWEEKIKHYYMVVKDVNKRKMQLRRKTEGYEDVQEHNLRISALKSEIKQKRLKILRDGRDVIKKIVFNRKQISREFREKCRAIYQSDSELKKLMVLSEALSKELDTIRSRIK